MKTNWPALRSSGLILASMAMATSPLLAQTQEGSRATAAASVISSVALTQAPQHASVRVEGVGRLDVRAARIQNPDRLVLDFSGARLAVDKRAISGESAPVLGVRLGQFRPNVARVVIDLTEATPYQISREGTAVVVLFEMLASSPSVSHSPSTTTADLTPQARAEFHYTAAAPRSVVSHASKSLQIPSPRFPLPGELTQPSFVLASFGAKTEPARPQPSAQQAAQQAVQQAGNAANTMATANSQTGGPAPTKYTGEPISVNLKDVDLKDFFRLIHEISGLNVILDPAVKGSLTIVLDEVPWDQALDIVLQNNGLDKQLNGNVLRIATRDTLKREAETQRDLDKAQAEAVAPVTVTRVLSYAKAATMKDTLKKFLSTRGDILSDDRSNQLVIRDIPSVIPTVDNLIRQLDRKAQQVEIEARVVSASRTFAQDLGTELGFSGVTTSGRSVFQGNPAVGASGQNPFTPLTPPVVTPGTQPSGNGITNGLPLVTNFAAGSPTTSIGFSHRSPNFALDFFITAAESKGVGKLLSKPKVITQNNEKATIKQGTKIPIQTTINNTISVQYIDAVLKLEVTPQITAEGTIFMDVLVENTQIDQGIPRIQGVPALDTQSTQTKVLVADGGTVVIGGVIVTSQNSTITETPLIGSLPIIGRLFKRTNVSINSAELLFFLTPRIVPG
jgi:type IV pilus secretin PilQ/predicted competence protein